jgi:adenylate cyclase, class 2
MPIELECKIRVASHAELRERLRIAKADYVGCVLETNSLFDSPDRALQRAGCGLRIRSTIVLEGRGPGSTLTYKGPRTPGPFKRRKEIETGISDAGAAAALLHALGYVERIILEKRRESWRLGPCRIELDELPRLGLFVEIEGPDEAAIREAMITLDLANAESISETYVSMVAGLGAIGEAGPVELRFT